MRVYFDTGPFIDYLSARGAANALLRSNERRGRAPIDIASDAERLFKMVSRQHTGATSCFTHYEVEEALYALLSRLTKGTSRADALLIPAARSITTQVQMEVDFFSISVLDLTAETVQLQLRQLDLQTQGIRAADALHAATAIRFNADLLVSTDEALLSLDGKLLNSVGRGIICADTVALFNSCAKSNAC